MSTIIEAPKSNFVPHPEGTFIGIMRDAFLSERPNPWKGMANQQTGKIDLRETITELVLEFLTDHEVEIDGKMLPGYVRYKATASVSENSNLRKFLKGWFPALKDNDFERFDADKLIGKGAYLTIAHNVDKKGGVWANVVGAMQPPKGSVLPTIPSDYVRHCDRVELTEAEKSRATPAGQIPDLDHDNDPLPF